MLLFFLALVGVSEEVRSRCHVKHSLPRNISESISQENFEQQNSNSTNSTSGPNRRQKSWDLLDQNAIAQARQHKQPSAHQVGTTYFLQSACIVFTCYKPVLTTRKAGLSTICALERCPVVCIVTSLLP